MFSRPPGPERFPVSWSFNTSLNGDREAPSEEHFTWLPIHITFNSVGRDEITPSGHIYLRSSIFVHYSSGTKKKNHHAFLIFYLKTLTVTLMFDFVESCLSQDWAEGWRFQFAKLTPKKTAPTTSDLWQQRLYHTSKWGKRGWVGLCFYKWSSTDGTVLTKRQEYCLLISVGGWGQGGGNLILLTSWGKFQISCSNRQSIYCWVSAFILLIINISFWCLLGFFLQWICSNLQNKI